MTTKHQPDSTIEVQPKNPLHGITLEAILNDLVRRYGWDGLGRRIDIRCFNHEPSIASSLKFLRRTAWAREQVETLYLASLRAGMSKRGPRKTGDATIEGKGDST